MLSCSCETPTSQRADRVRNDSRWRFYELQTGHNLHYTAPEETVRILDELAATAIVDLDGSSAS